MMQERRPIHTDPRQHIARTRPDHPVLYFSPAELQATARRFLTGFPGMVTYAVKANPRREVLENLVAAGIRAFDVASPAEMSAVRAVAPDAVLHYHNPIRSRAEVAAGIATGVASWSVDDAESLRQLADAPRATAVAVRFKLARKGGAYDFGTKFGAAPEQAAALLREAAAMGFEPALTFHPGTQCEDTGAHAHYIAEAARIAERAGVRLAKLNTGGGFPAKRPGPTCTPEQIFAEIDAAAGRAFGADRPVLICEPGRGLVAGSALLATRIKARRGDTVYLNDGVYGGLAELRDMPAVGRVEVLSQGGEPMAGPRCAMTIFGPTCDSLDRLPEPLMLPDAAGVGDFLLFHAMGAYSIALSTTFNGYGLARTETVGSFSGHPARSR